MKNTLTKQQAIEAMKKGQKVTHIYFSSNEWVAICPETNKIITEEGYKHNTIDFWIFRTGPSWETGYSLYETEKDTTCDGCSTPLNFEEVAYENDQGHTYCTECHEAILSDPESRGDAPDPLKELKQHLKNRPDCIIITDLDDKPNSCNTIIHQRGITGSFDIN
nr:hypothetical protein [Mucilaginibacter sp. L294]